MGDPIPPREAEETGFDRGAASGLGPRILENGFLNHGEDVPTEAFDYEK